MTKYLFDINEIIPNVYHDYCLTIILQYNIMALGFVVPIRWI